MGATRLLDGLALVLLLQIVSPRPDVDRMIPKPEVWIRDALRTPLETQTLREAPWTGKVLRGPLNSPPSKSPRSPARSRPKRHGPEEQGCRLRTMLVRVKDLGLGYGSEETILFKYCSGSCPKARGNHDLTLALLVQKSEIPALGEPCCRPSHYEDVAFLDDGHQWQEVEQLSASSCSCVG
uniref:persephin n=1 Tax=Euleptes europaea TaxID=460621 RepID=UPI002541F0D2|nr:persephin [Euleptes europaea]